MNPLNIATQIATLNNKNTKTKNTKKNQTTFYMIPELLVKWTWENNKCLPNLLKVKHSKPRGAAEVGRRFGYKKQDENSKEQMSFSGAKIMVLA